MERAHLSSTCSTSTLLHTRKVRAAATLLHSIPFPCPTRPRDASTQPRRNTHPQQLLAHPTQHVPLCKHPPRVQCPHRPRTHINSPCSTPSLRPTHTLRRDMLREELFRVVREQE